MSTAPGAELVQMRANTLSLMSDSEINRSWRLAEALAASGAFPDPDKGKMTPALAFATMLVGHDLGLSPTRALMSIDIVEGKPRINSVALAGFVKARGYDYRIVEHDAEKCSIDFYEIGQASVDASGTVEPGERVLLGNSTFTIEEAKQAGLIRQKSAWEKYPKNMLFARAMSNGVKWHCADAMGGVPVYTEGDSFEHLAELTAGEGSGAAGIDLGPKVEKVLARAAELGHAGLADRAAAEMALGSRSPEHIKAWVEKANKTLDELEIERAEAESIPEADVVQPPTPGQLWRTADQLRLDADQAEADGNVDEATTLRIHADETQEKGDAQADAGAFRDESAYLLTLAGEAVDGPLGDARAENLRKRADETMRRADEMASGDA